MEEVEFWRTWDRDMDDIEADADGSDEEMVFFYFENIKLAF
jgi:hypothetical protein